LIRVRPINIVTATKSERRSKVKTVMGKQYNKILKRRRRESYLKRKKEHERTKTKPAAAAA